jgi:hypothetical protein
MNQLPQRIFIGAERVDRIEPGQAQAAQRASALFIQRKLIQEGSLAIDAKIIRVQRCRLTQTLRAYRDSRDFVKGLAADAAIVGEKAAKSLLCVRQNRPAKIGQQGT